MSPKDALKRAGAPADPQPAPPEPNVMVQKYGPDPGAHTCAGCYLLAYRTLPAERRKRPVYPNVYPCAGAANWPPDQPACKLWRPIPQDARPRKAR